MESEGFPSKQEFRAWLGEQVPESIVGQVGADADCPLARFLTILFDGVVVGFTSILCGPYPHVEIDLPAWAVRFVHAIDEESDFDVCASRAIEILCEIEG